MNLFTHLIRKVSMQEKRGRQPSDRVPTTVTVDNRRLRAGSANHIIHNSITHCYSRVWSAELWCCAESRTCRKKIAAENTSTVTDFSGVPWRCQHRAN